jgi:hypothetical protein
MMIKSDEIKNHSDCVVLHGTLPGLMESPTMTIKALSKDRISLCPEFKSRPVKLKVNLSL